MRLAPRPLTGVLVMALYLAVFYGVWVLNGIDYQHIGQSARTLMRWYVAPLAAGAVVLVVVTTVLGWWRPALFEAKRATPRWLLVGPVFMACSAVATVLAKDTSETTQKMLALLVIGSLLVGFNEELVTRGLLVVGFRGGRYREAQVWFFSSLLFGLMHLPNWIFGAGPGAMLQVLLTFLFGTMMYLLRRASGTIIWCMLLHGLWDFATFIGKDSLIQIPLTVANGILAIVLIVVLLRRDPGQPLHQAGVSRTSAST